MSGITQYGNFAAAILAAQVDFFKFSRLIHTTKWQGVDISTKPEMATYELLNWSFQTSMNGMDLDGLRIDISPNLPWADDHFEERVCGEPLNPGLQWAKWPWGHSADKFRDHQGMFNHSYSERMWPTYAGQLGPLETPKEAREAFERRTPGFNTGIRYGFGDLNDVVELLVKDPDTRQAYLPIWFPEDTGIGDGGRKPCSIGYHFILRNGGVRNTPQLHVVYQLRSCEFVRHFRDDIYLTARLLLWVIEECRKRDPKWGEVRPGTFTMHITSFHLFKSDWVGVFGCAPR